MTLEKSGFEDPNDQGAAGCQNGLYLSHHWRYQQSASSRCWATYETDCGQLDVGGDYFSEFENKIREYFV